WGGAVHARTRGRGIGLLHKLQTYQLQDAGDDTVDANLKLGLPADARDYGIGPRFWLIWGPFDAAADQQPGKAGRAGRLRFAHHRAVPLPVRPMRRTSAI
ncbi:GTP cyclohydrolase II family protein, partial [Mycobacterium ulcerans str. Harvey]